MWGDTSRFGDAGGGFFGNESGAGDTPAKGQKPRRFQNVVPVVIQQIKNCEGDEFTLYGMQAQILRLVGIVVDLDVQSTKAMYNIRDHTGHIKGIWWLETDKDSRPNLPVIKENTYVKILGSLRIQDGEKMIMVLKMFPVDDLNVITTHLLETIRTKLEAQHMANNPGAVPAVVRKNNPGAELANSMYFLENSAQDINLTPLQAQVHDILKRTPSISGCAKYELLKQFPKHKSTEVLEALEFLISEGHAYSTIDTEHFKATDPF